MILNLLKTINPKLQVNTQNTKHIAEYLFNVLPDFEPYKNLIIENGLQYMTSFEMFEYLVHS